MSAKPETHIPNQDENQMSQAPAAAPQLIVPLRLGDPVLLRGGSEFGVQGAPNAPLSVSLRHRNHPTPRRR